PKIHNAALMACGLAGDYYLFPIHPDDTQGLRDMLNYVLMEEIHGLNVTIPHKHTVIPLLDELTPIARTIGAVNTIYARENKLIGDNTDVPAFLSDLKRFSSLECDDLLVNMEAQTLHKHALVLGAGGGARAVVYALLNDGWQIAISTRQMKQAGELADTFKNYDLHILDSGLTNMDLSNIDLVVNTTPVGMIPNIDQSPWPPGLPLPARSAIYDLVYNPRETKLVRDARAQGIYATTGLGMLIEQAALAFKIWTGHNPPRNILFEAVGQPTLINSNRG
ncbi:MAG TPA: shikimate dehydrogenase, partial [Anaerolineales bacterium]|nr:shikimate dehydrogenase [Anaerolineales bacterium]